MISAEIRLVISSFSTIFCAEFFVCNFGKTSFDDMRTLNGELCGSYKAVCSALGILQDSEEWENVLSEAFSSLTGHRAGSLFATMLVFCELPETLELFDKFVDILADDFQFRNPNCPFYLLRAFALQLIGKELNAFA